MVRFPGFVPGPPIAIDDLAVTDTKNHSDGTPSGSLEGRRFLPGSPAELAEAIELAFDYRGDVTIELASGERLDGYVFNRSTDGPAPALDLFPTDAPGVRNILYSDIRSIAFSGEDTATGKSWEAWVTKKESERRAEIERVTADAKARGHL
ncbi:conserved protein of unknown function [Nitrospira japonica]|uniref:Uncharacterized protein n=1 Tax=Nitrospira japonica TaxID=1325564 RepID=A0A1W1I4S9_9BACT|nr:hypothetical protein [Nitrospira japonica]SLM48018.1 conserved protein of unknown function [Nitrospira japonica]